ncbi:MurR/RpiR family transcriptional regulator [Cellvibrio japonicus]|nr:MurR/RpiR family transcriptional regulator [Cellvibrio japonicus]QEI11062.1 MurR/RpiR family transcriptional regulator [Cellvibrio japonicus]QEI14637.1 MurR/RpiR family transcriptional regulator [Cellvibrio japonicus]QEI18216.1 MurR/RpiR family transcriptional regulator [Cellvibrio japonicus]
MTALFDIVYHIRSNRDRLSATEQKIADIILDDIAFAAAASIDQLATKASVSIATISRFAKAVGCEDIRDLKLKLAQASAVGTRFLADVPVVEESAFYARICSEVESTLRANLARFVEADFRAGANALNSARLIYVGGMGGGSTMLADEVQYRIARLGLPVTAYHDPVLLRMLAATLTEKDVLVLLSVTGVTPELLEVADIAREYGAQIIAMTAPQSPLAEKANVLLPVMTEETDFIFKPSASRYGVLLAVDILATELALLRKQESKELLRRVKFALDEYRGGDNRLPLGD